MRLRKARTLRILDFDIENRPLSYLGMDFTTAEVTAVAASWAGDKQVSCWLLGVDEPLAMLDGFARLYDEADMVTGHYIRKHDLPIINGSLLEAGLPPLPARLTQDTKMDLIRRQGISASQESLAEMLGVPAAKYHMSQPKWRAANRLTAEGIEQTRRRVVDDVTQHKLLRLRLLEAGALRAPQVWWP